MLRRDLKGHKERHLQLLASEAWGLGSFGCIHSLPFPLWLKVFLLALTALQPLGEAHNCLGRWSFLFVLQASSRHGTKAIFTSVSVTSSQQLQFWELKYWLEVEGEAHHAEIRVEKRRIGSQPPPPESSLCSWVSGALLAQQMVTIRTICREESP